MEYVSAKASVVRTSLVLLIPNIGGPNQRRRILPSTVVTWMLTYGIFIWADALKIQKSRRMASAYIV